MEPQDWFAALTAVAAAVGLFFAASEIRQARRSHDLQALQDFTREARERELALGTDNGDDWNRAFNDYLNFLETHAAAINRRLFGSGSRDIVRDKLIDALAMLQSQPDAHALIENAVLSEATFTELIRFQALHKTTIQRRAAAYKQRSLPSGDASQTHS